MQYRLIYHQGEKYEVRAMCRFLGVSRAAYYARVKRLEQADADGERMKQVQEACERSHRTYGYRRIVLWLDKQKGICIKHKAVLRLMNKLNLRSVARKRKAFKGFGAAQILREVMRSNKCKRFRSTRKIHKVSTSTGRAGSMAGISMKCTFQRSGLRVIYIPPVATAGAWISRQRQFDSFYPPLPATLVRDHFRSPHFEAWHQQSLACRRLPRPRVGQYRSV